MSGRNASRSSSMKRKLSDSSLDSYSAFKNHLMSTEEISINSEDNMKTFPSTSNKQNAQQVPPQELNLNEPFNRLLSDAQEIKGPKVAGLNKKRVSTRRKPAVINPTANGVRNNRVTRSTSRNEQNSLPGCSKKLDVPVKRINRKLFDAFDAVVPSKKATKKNSETNKSVSGLSDSAVSLFLQKFDQEMAIGSVGQPAKALIIDSARSSIENLSKAENNKQAIYNKLRKRSTHENRTVTRLTQEEAVSLPAQNDYDSDDSFHDKSFTIDEDALTSSKSNNTDKSKYITKNEISSEIRKKTNLHKSVYGGSFCSDTDSISSILSNVSQYGRVRKPVQKYINATIFGGRPKKSEIAEIKQNSTLINSHKCKNKSARNQETARLFLDQFNFPSPNHKKNDSPDFNTLANQVTASNTRPTACRSQSRTSKKSSHIENHPDKQKPNQFDLLSPSHSNKGYVQLQKLQQIQKSTDETTSSANESNLSYFSKSQNRTSSNTSSKTPLFISDHPEDQNLNRSNKSNKSYVQLQKLQQLQQIQNSTDETTSSANESNLSYFSKSQNRTSSNTSSKTPLFISDHPENQNLNRSNKTISPQFDLPTPSTSGNKIASRSNNLCELKTPSETFNKNYSNEQESNNLNIFEGVPDICSLPEETVFKKPMNIPFNRNARSSKNSPTSPKCKKKIIIHQNLVLHSGNEADKPMKHVKPSIHNLHQASLLAGISRPSISHSPFKTTNDVFENVGRKPDQNKIHSVVKDEVVSCKWYSPEPDFDSVLSNDNIHYSMSDLRSFYTNVMVGYLKIDVGHMRSMQVLKDCIMLYFIERGAATFRVSQREITGQIGSTFFIPLGVEYTITNSKSEDLILKFVKMSPTVSEP